jgi:hypothetical protein
MHALQPDPLLRTGMNMVPELTFFSTIPNSGEIQSGVEHMENRMRCRLCYACTVLRETDLMGK